MTGAEANKYRNVELKRRYMGSTGLISLCLNLTKIINSLLVRVVHESPHWSKERMFRGIELTYRHRTAP